MAKTKAETPKFDAPRGMMPALQYLLPAQLQIDPTYQRSIEADDSQRLIRKIAQTWDWDLCQPLVVARRENGELFVIDGQHRLAAAKLRGDIQQLPAVVVNSQGPKDEASSFVHLNARRRPLTALQMFHAAIASGEPEAVAIRDAIEDAGLVLGRHVNLQLGKPMTVINVAGIREAWRRYGQKVTTEALHVLATAFAGERQLYAGTIFPGIVALVASEIRAHGDRESGTMQPARFARLTAMVGKPGQLAWRRSILELRAADAGLSMGTAAIAALQQAWDKLSSQERPAAPTPRAAPAPIRPAAKPALFDHDGKAWCSQCEQRVTQAKANACASQFCAVKQKVA